VVGRLSHVNIEVEDVAAARAFYAGVLQMSEIPRAEGARRPGAWFDLGAAQLHVSEQRGCAAGNRASTRHFCVIAEDLDSVRAALVRARAPIEERGAGRLFTRDPSGNRIEIQSQPQ